MTKVIQIVQQFYKTRQSGNWSDSTTWLLRRYDGKFYPAPNAPGQTDNVYIEQGHTVTLTANANCYNLNYYKDSINKINTGAFTLSIYGSFRRYIGVAPGTYSSGANGSTQWLIGSFSLKGVTRTIDVSQYGSARNLYGFTTSIDLQDSNQVLTLNDPTISSGAISFGGTVNINTGTLKLNNCTLRSALTDPSVANNDGTINVNSTLEIANTTVPFQQINRSATTKISQLNIGTNGLLVIDNTTQLIYVTLTFGTNANVKITNNVTLNNEINVNSSGTAIPFNLIVNNGFNYNLNTKNINIRGTLQGGGTVSNGTLNQNHA